MAIITADDIYSRLYEEQVDEITRDNDALIDRAIDSAIQEVKMYMPKYDLLQLFGTDTIPATVDDTYLKNICVDVAVWTLVKLGRPGIDFAIAKEIYDSTKKTLKEIQTGTATPDGWPFKNIENTNITNEINVFASGNKRRSTHF